jgi:hypothetical protein
MSGRWLSPKYVAASFYRDVWTHSLPSPFRALVLTLLAMPNVLHAPMPEDCDPLLVLSPWHQFLPRFLRQLAKTGLGSQLLLPSGEWSSNIPPEDLFVCLTSPFEQLPSTISAAFDVPLLPEHFLKVGYTTTQRFRDLNLANSAINGSGPLGNIAPAGYARLIDPLRHSGARLFIKTYTGAMVVLTWPRTQGNFDFISGLLKGPDPRTLNNRTYGLSLEMIGGMVDGSLMEGCRPYFVNGDRSFNIGAQYYVAVVALETAVFVTLPLYSGKSKKQLKVLKTTASVVERMTGARRQEMEDSLRSAWEAVMESYEGPGEVDDELKDAMSACKERLRVLLQM